MASPSPDAASSDASARSPASVDLYRDTPVRFLGYANELGESFKPLIPRIAYFARTASRAPTSRPTRTTNINGTATWRAASTR